MNRDDIIKLAREAGFVVDDADFVYAPRNSIGIQLQLERFATLVAALVAAAEREACAKVAEETICDTHLPTGVRIYGSRAAAAIRARGQA